MAKKEMKKTEKPARLVRVRRIGVRSMAILGAIAGFGITFVFALIALFFMAVGALGMGIAIGQAALMAMMMAVMVGLYSVLGLFFGALVALVYNFAAPRVGLLELRVE